MDSALFLILVKRINMNVQRKGAHIGVEIIGRFLRRTDPRGNFSIVSQTGAAGDDLNFIV